MAADGSEIEWYYVLETTEGTTPASPSWTRLRSTGGGLTRNVNYLPQDELTGDRFDVNLDEGTRDVSGTINTLLYYGEHDELLESALCNTFVADTPIVGTAQLKAGSATLESYSLMAYHSDLAGGDKPYYVYTGCKIASIGIGINLDNYLTLDINWVGFDGVAPASAAPAGSVLGSKGVIEPMKATTATLNEGGSSIAIITELSFNLDNSLAQDNALGSAIPVDTTRAKAIATGSMSYRLENATLIEKWYNGTASSVDITATDVAGNTLKISYPEIKYTGGEKSSGAGTIIVTAPFTGLKDATEATNMIIERNPI